MCTTFNFLTNTMVIMVKMVILVRMVIMQSRIKCVIVASAMRAE